MKMKYFRFLYGETMQCFMHLGEIKDTLTDEHFKFMYLRKTDGHVSQSGSEHTPFLYPNHLNLVVLGSVDADMLPLLKKLLKGAVIDTLIMPAGTEVNGEICASEIICLAKGNDYSVTSAGWKLVAASYAEGAIALFHDLDKSTDKNPLADCVMSVKAADREKRCCREAEPDSFGCALGCTLHQDYDVCKYRRASEAMPYPTGTLLMAGLDGGESGKLLERDIQAYLDEVRFIGLGNQKCFGMQEEGSLQIPPSEYKKYFIGADTELDDGTIAAICRKGPYHVPVVLKEAQGICCSGLFKYDGE